MLFFKVPWVEKISYISQEIIYINVSFFFFEKSHVNKRHHLDRKTTEKGAIGYRTQWVVGSQQLRITCKVVIVEDYTRASLAWAKAQTRVTETNEK